MASLRTAVALPGRRLSDVFLRLRREVVYSDRPALIGLMLLAVVITTSGALEPDVVPYTAMLLPMFLGSLWLWPKSLPWFVVYCLCGVLVMAAVQTDINWRSAFRLATTFVIALVIMLTAFRRSTLGVSGPRGESMLVDLRDRIQQQGLIPPLPTPWEVTAATRSAGGTQFAGDFVGASRSADGRTLQVMVVDVSGKGIEAGTRALLLSGAFGGLASALPPDRFLLEANEYLLKQQWEEGFASAIHLCLDLATGAFEIRKAGHPPAIWLHAGSGEWSVLNGEGPLLGLLPDVEFEVVRGRLQDGDVLMLYTDGLVETTDRDLSSGIDKLAGRGQLLFRNGFDGAAQRIVDDLGSGLDDCALVLVRR